MTYDTMEFSTRRRRNSLAVDRIDEQEFLRTKLTVGEEGEALPVSEDNPLPVAIISGGGGGGGGSSDITSVIPGTSAEELGKAEDDQHLSGSTGVLGLAVRRDANTTMVSNDGDYSPLQVDASGALKVNVVTGGGGGGGGVSATDDIAFTAGSGDGTPIMGFATSDSVDSGDVGVVAMTTARALHVAVQNSVTVADGGGSITVDGTVAATQSGTWNVGTVTPGTASNNLGKAEDAAHSSGDVGVMALAVRQNSQADFGADGDYVPMSIDDNGGVRVSIVAGAGAGGTSATDGATFTRDSTAITPIGARVETSAPTLTNGDASALSMTTAGALRVNVASGGIAGVTEDDASTGGEEGVLWMVVRRDSASSGVSADGDYAVPNVDATGALRVTGAGGTQYTEDAASVGAEQLMLAGSVRRDTAATSAGTNGDYATINTDANGRLWTTTVVDTALPAGSNNIGDVDIASALPAGTNTIGGITNVASATVGGHSTFYTLDADETEEQIKGSAGKVFWIHAMNMSASVRYLKFYNGLAASVVVGTDLPVMSFPLPTLATTNGAGFTIHFGDTGVAFNTGICVAATTGVADNNTGAPGANEVIVNVGYL